MAIRRDFQVENGLVVGQDATINGRTTSISFSGDGANLTNISVSVENIQGFDVDMANTGDTIIYNSDSGEWENIPATDPAIEMAIALG